MATLEELVVNLVAETSGLRAELDKASKATVGASNKMESAIKEFSEGSSKSLNFFQQSMATASGFLASQVVLGAFNALKDAAGALFNTLVVQGVAAAQVQEDAIQKMNTQLALSGDYTRAASKDMQDFASQLQSTTKVGDEVILNSLALAKTFGKSNEETKKLTQAAIELSAATGLTLEGSIKNLGKTYAGMTGELGESLPIIRTLTKEQLMNGAALDLIINRFGGAASAAVKTFSGSLEQNKNTFGDLTESIGFVITQNQAVISTIQKVTEVFGGATDAVNDSDKQLKVLAGETLVAVINSTAGLVVAFDTFGRVASFITNQVEIAFAGLGAAITGVLSVFDKSYEESFNAFSAQAEAAVARTTEVFSEDTMLGDVATKLYEIGDAAESGLSKVKAGAESMVEPVNVAREAVVKLTEAEQQRQDQIKAFASALAEQGAALDSNYVYEQESLQANLEQRLVTEEEFMAARQELVLAYQEQERTQLEEARAEGLVTEKQYQDAKTALEKKQSLEAMKIATDKKKFEELTNKQREENFKGTLGVISTLSQSNSKELAAIGKAAAITQATIDGYAAVQKALASAPPPFNFALAALVGAATAQNIAKISSVGLRDGGTIMGGGANQDTVPASLTKGETVITRGLTDKLDAFLNGQGGGSGGDGRLVIELRPTSEFIEMIEAKIVERQNIGVSLLGAV